MSVQFDLEMEADVRQEGTPLVIQAIWYEWHDDEKNIVDWEWADDPDWDDGPTPITLTQLLERQRLQRQRKYLQARYGTDTPPSIRDYWEVKHG